MTCEHPRVLILNFVEEQQGIRALLFGPVATEPMAQWCKSCGAIRYKVPDKAQSWTDWLIPEREPE